VTVLEFALSKTLCEEPAFLELEAAPHIRTTAKGNG